jgi:hypothetical protein
MILSSWRTTHSAAVRESSFTSLIPHSTASQSLNFLSMHSCNPYLPLMPTTASAPTSKQPTTAALNHFRLPIRRPRPRRSFRLLCVRHPRCRLGPAPPAAMRPQILDCRTRRSPAVRRWTHISLFRYSPPYHQNSGKTHHSTGTAAFHCPHHHDRRRSTDLAATQAHLAYTH